MVELTPHERAAYIPVETCQILDFLAMHLSTLSMSEDRTGWLSSLRNDIVNRLVDRKNVYGTWKTPEKFNVADYVKNEYDVYERLRMERSERFMDRAGYFQYLASFVYFNNPVKVAKCNRIAKKCSERAQKIRGNV